METLDRLESGVGWRGGGGALNRQQSGGVFDGEGVLDRQESGGFLDGVVLYCLRQSLTMERQSAARSSVFDGGAVIRCSFVGFEWCALDGQESRVVPFGGEW